MLGETRALELLEQALRGSEAEQTEVVLMAQTSQLTRFADSVIHQSTAEEGGSLMVRAVFGNRIGIASTNLLDDSGIRETVCRASQLARLSAPNADFKSLPGPQPIIPVNGYAEATARSSPEERAAVVATLA